MKDVNQVYRVGMLLLNNFTLLSYASAVESLRMANQLSETELYKWYTISDDGAPVKASEGHSISVDFSVRQRAELDAAFVIGGENIHHNFGQNHIAWLQNLNRRNILLGGFCSGTYLLAAAGLLDNQQCSVHADWIASINETFPKVTANNRFFSTSDSRVTSSGGVASMDAMLALISKQRGEPLAKNVAGTFLYDAVHSHTDEQAQQPINRQGNSHPKLAEAVSIMRTNTEEPLRLDEIAGYIEISRRQLERLFQKHYHCTPSRYYISLRLNKARQLLQRTNLSVMDIATACGFVSITHFSKCYRDNLGASPRHDRIRLANSATRSASLSTLKPHLKSLLSKPNNFNGNPSAKCKALKA